MIVVHINSAGVERVYFQSNSDLVEDLCLAVWPAVREELNRLDNRLRKAAQKALAMAEKEGLETGEWGSGFYDSTIL